MTNFSGHTPHTPHTTIMIIRIRLDSPIRLRDWIEFSVRRTTQLRCSTLEKTCCHEAKEKEDEL